MNRLKVFTVTTLKTKMDTFSNRNVFIKFSVVTPEDFQFLLITLM